jgi:hypothetical protein
MTKKKVCNGSGSVKSKEKSPRRRPGSFDFRGDDRLVTYVRMHFEGKLSMTAFHIYALGLHELEIRKTGLCKPVTANYLEIEKYSWRNHNCIKDRLIELRDAGLITLKIGRAGKGSSEATEIRRLSLEELKGNKPVDLIKDYTPETAKRVLSRLKSRSFVYGQNRSCKPVWVPSITNRICSKGTNVQKDSEELRARSLRAGLNPGEVLIYADIALAEPSILRRTLADKGLIPSNWPTDPYQVLSKLLGITREKAKEKLNTLAYAKSATLIIKHWQVRARNFVRSYAEGLDEFKEVLFQQGKPKEGLRRHVVTRAGTVIQKEPRPVKPYHRGTALSHYAQGTVADILNSATDQILAEEDSTEAQLLFPIHDGLYLIQGKDDPTGYAASRIIQTAESLGFDLEVKTETWPYPV